MTTVANDAFKDWIGADPSYCIDNADKKKVSLVLTKTTRNDPNHKISGDKWCKSCYSIYHSLCGRIAILLGSKLLDGTYEPNIHDLRYVLVNKIAKDRHDLIEEKVNNSYVHEKVQEYEELLFAIIECIEKRIFHNKKCYIPKFSKSTSLDPHQVGDKAHDYAILHFCLEFKRVFIFYNMLTKHYNIKPMSFIISNRDTLYSGARATCDNRIRKYKEIETFIDSVKHSYKNAPSNVHKISMSDEEINIMRHELFNFNIFVSFHNKISKSTNRNIPTSRQHSTYEITPYFEKSDYYTNLHQTIKTYHGRK